MAAKKATIRKRLGEDATADYELIRDALREATQAKKRIWMTCPHCSKRSEQEVRDSHATVKAAELWLREGFGRPQEDAGDTSFVVERRVYAPDGAVWDEEVFTTSAVAAGDDDDD